MPRRSYTHRPLPSADPRYGSVLVSRFIGKINFQGGKSLATRILYQAMEHLKEKVGEDPSAILSRAVENCRPLLETKPRQVGGATYQVPVEVRKSRGETRSMRWIIENAGARKGAPMHMRLAEEILQASKREGPSFKKREDIHKMAESNRAFAHYRW